MIPESRHVRLYGPPLALWDVRDVEAHVRTLLEAELRRMGARLDGSKYDDALSYLVSLCWRISGLAGDRRSPRFEHFVRLHISELLSGENGREEMLGPYASRPRAELGYAAWIEQQNLAGLLVSVTFLERRPSGAYDPSVGLAFSTYSRRILSRRVVDWFRTTLGDNRYRTQPRMLSLDQLLDEREERAGADSLLDHCGPGSRLDFVDELNRHAYTDPTEEVLTRAAVAR